MEKLVAICLTIWSLVVAGLTATAVDRSPAGPIKATLSQAVTETNQPVQLQFEITGSDPSDPPDIDADGLAIEFTGRSTQVNLGNFQPTLTTIYTYVVTPTKEGTFKIPSVDLMIAGKNYKTPALTLQVRPAATNNASGQNRLYYGELVVPKNSAYVGEDIPVELRFYFDSRVSFQPYPQGQFPIIDGDDFVTKKYPEPIAREETINGHDYQVLIYKTAISGAKAGRLNIKSAFQEFMVRVPVIQRIPPDSDDLDQDPNQSFFNSFQPKDVKIPTNGANLEIKSLPVQGRPASFSGAIGQFTASAAINPAKTKVGDPIRLQVKIKGVGNFDRIEPPALSQTDQWRVYAPTDDLENLDDIGLSAIKTFSYSMVPQGPVKKAPKIEFSFFDLATEKYVTLTLPPNEVEVEGKSSPSNGEANHAAGTASNSSNTPPAEVFDIKPSRAAVASFVPLLDRPWFWVFQAIPAGGLVILAFFYLLKSMQKAYLPIQPWIRERKLLHGKLDSGNKEEFFTAASRLLALDVLIKAKGKLKQLPPEEALTAKPISEEFRSSLGRIIRTHGELSYGALSSPPLSEQERAQIKELVGRWEKVK